MPAALLAATCVWSALLEFIRGTVRILAFGSLMMEFNSSATVDPRSGDRANASASDSATGRGQGLLTFGRMRLLRCNRWIGRRANFPGESVGRRAGSNETKLSLAHFAHGKHRTLGSVEHPSFDQGRDQTRQAFAEYVQSGLPGLLKSKSTSCTPKMLLDDHSEPRAVAELKGGCQYPDRIRSVFPWLLRCQIIEIDVPTMQC